MGSKDQRVKWRTRLIASWACRVELISELLSKLRMDGSSFTELKVPIMYLYLNLLPRCKQGEYLFVTFTRRKSN